MTYEALCARNPGRRIVRVTDPEFLAYGRVYTQYDLSAVQKWAESIPVPEIGNYYQASDPKAEALDVVQQIALDLYGGMPVQAGPCCGRNQVLNGIEYHVGSEVAVMLQPCVLFLGKLQDLQPDNTYDAAKAVAFYAEAGQVVQTYETTLHYTPCRAGDYFFTLCFLPRGTGNPLAKKGPRILKKQNKWFITHPDNLDKVKAGDFPGLLGEMPKIEI